MIDSFEGKYRFLSNFYLSPITYEGIEYPSVEHAYQAAKTFDQKIRQKVADCPTPNEAKKVSYPRISLWAYTVMCRIVGKTTNNS